MCTWLHIQHSCLRAQWNPQQKVFQMQIKGSSIIYNSKTEEKIVLTFIRVVVKHSIFRQIKLSIVVNTEGGFGYGTHVPWK